MKIFRWGGVSALLVLGCGESGGASTPEAGLALDSSALDAAAYGSTGATNTHTSSDDDLSQVDVDSDADTPLNEDASHPSDDTSEVTETRSDAGGGLMEASTTEPTSAEPHSDSGASGSAGGDDPDTHPDLSLSTDAGDVGFTQSTTFADASTSHVFTDAASSSSAPVSDAGFDASAPPDASTDAAAASTATSSATGTSNANPVPTSPPSVTTAPPQGTTPEPNAPDASSADAGQSGAGDAGDASVDDLSNYCAPVLDQVNVAGDEYYVLSSQDSAHSFGQTFTVGIDGRLAAIEVELVPQSVTPNALRIEIFDASNVPRGSVELPLSEANFGSMNATAAPGAAWIDVTSLRIDVASGQTYYFEVTIPEQTTDSCVASYCLLSGASCDGPMDCYATFGLGTDSHAPSDLQGRYPGGALHIDSVVADHDSYWEDRDLQFKTLVRPLSGSPECLGDSGP